MSLEMLLRYGVSMGPILALERAGAETVEDILAMRRKEVQNVRGIGKKAMDELDAALRRMGSWYREG